MLMESGSCVLAEPVMQLTVSGEEDHSHNLLPDLNKRRAQVQDISVRAAIKVD